MLVVAVAADIVPPVVEPREPVEEVKVTIFPMIGALLMSVTVAESVVCPPGATVAGDSVTARLAGNTVRLAWPILALAAVAVSISVHETAGAAHAPAV